ncbi:hypothetical protein BDV98DRAFT_109833 [Pterulicium gracile]|uniref:F-box domain-containing protein n=1 Tax=Pterulicium gracile TaxID=1884261 RepID=A0A5C3PZ05_9AGAR|nr:hypothetical protein BDV98DRAFT_109833 [Pterula gracilis]
MNESSLDLLWESIPSALKLLRLMPADCWEWIQAKSIAPMRKHMVLHFTRSLTITDFDRVLVHSQRVRVIGGSGHFYTAFMPTESIQFKHKANYLSPIISTLALFPQLRTLTLITHDDAPHTLYFAMMVPSLQKINWTIVLDNWPSTVELLFTQFAKNCTAQLASLDLKHESATVVDVCTYAKIEHFMYPFLPTFASLKDLRITYTAANLQLLLETLSHLHQIEVLEASKTVGM